MMHRSGWGKKKAVKAGFWLLLIRHNTFFPLAAINKIRWAAFFGSVSHRRATRGLAPERTDPPFSSIQKWRFYKCRCLLKLPVLDQAVGLRSSAQPTSWSAQALCCSFYSQHKIFSHIIVRRNERRKLFADDTDRTKTRSKND